MNKKFLQNNFFISFISSIIIFLLLFIIWKDLFYQWDSTLSYQIQKFFPWKINNNIVLVEINKETTKKLWFPFDRKYYIKTIENLKKDWAKIIAFDILFDNNFKYNIDKKLASTFKKSWNIILWARIEKNWISYPIFLDDIFSKKIKDNSIKLYKNTIKKIGFFNPLVDKRTFKIYSLLPYSKLKNWIKLEHISFAIVRDFLNLWDKLQWYNKNYSKYYFWNEKIPVKKGAFIIKYENPNKFNSESFLNVYKWAFKKWTFKNKIILIWYTSEGSQKDEYTVPLFWKIKWTYAILNTINNLLNKTYTTYFNPQIEAFIIFLLIFLLNFSIISRKTSNTKWFFIWIFSIFIISFIIYFFIYSFFVNTKNLHILLNFPLEYIIWLFLSFFIAFIINFLKEDKNKKVLNKALSQYVSKDVAKEILSWEWKINLNWEKKEIAIFFSDIEWFTSISEKMQAQELVAFLQKYLWASSEIIMNNKWFIDKYEWDAIMALFWVFWETWETKTYDILKSALEQQEKLKELNKDFIKTLWQEIKVRMWIHLWEAVVWNIWAKNKKMEFTALWDSVNLASRLEWVNKFYNTYICCSENLFEKEKENFVFRYLDNIKVKWKNKWVKIFELIGYSWKVSQKILNRIIIFEKALNLYFQKDFSKAKELFKQAEELWDKTATIFIFRCDFFLKNPPWENWNWIWEFKEK
jgi:adenylate cyclase